MPRLLVQPLKMLEDCFLLRFLQQWDEHCSSRCNRRFKRILSLCRRIYRRYERPLNGIKDIFKSVFNGIISTVEVAINHIVEGLNGISFDVPDWVPLAGGQHFGFNVSSMKLPRLATGTVVPRQAGEFAAILGDNNREAEVVSPLSTIKQALLEALKEAGAGLGGDIQLMINLDGKVVYENVVKRNRLARKQTGKNPLLM